ncbi:hypothetical protein B0J13DRAFT_300923 [Dactylonectria estremocensis]|uniref:Uncharacterized protein n=1 Tax=Dactylonectria estremocensis TaxID=1079267 RepID=A0A9P9J9H4_9HYPO|nr:hypothetical protein B0J13DRAFT_300923 [Dactylonectria estremocensis]
MIDIGHLLTCLYLVNGLWLLDPPPPPRDILCIPHLVGMDRPQSQLSTSQPARAGPLDKRWSTRTHPAGAAVGGHCLAVALAVRADSAGFVQGGSQQSRSRVPRKRYMHTAPSCDTILSHDQETIDRRRRRSQHSDEMDGSEAGIRNYEENESRNDAMSVVPRCRLTSKTRSRWSAAMAQLREQQ